MADQTPGSGSGSSSSSSFQVQGTFGHGHIHCASAYRDPQESCLMLALTSR